MATLADYPYLELECTKDGTVSDPASVDALLTELTTAQTTDLLVISHGWNNDIADARQLYQHLVPLIAAEVVKRPDLTSRKFAVLGVLWPSKKFADADLTAGGAASLTPSGSDELVDRLRELQDFFDGPESDATIQQAIAEATQLDHDPNARIRYVALMKTIVAGMMHIPDSEPEDIAASHLNKETPDALLTRLSEVELTEPVGGSTGGAESIGTSVDMIAGNESGGAEGFLDFSGFIDGARNLLNFTTYYQMKARAGQVGVLGLHPVLAQVKQTLPSCRLHLIGHSFGARLVTAATAGPDTQSVLPVATLSLLQGAFSHYGFADDYLPGKDGFFRSVLTQQKVTGPIIISQTHNDKAVGLAYAVASRIAGQTAEAIGDANDLYGGMGANGAQKSGASTQFTLNAGTTYTFQPGTLYNLNADATIHDHSDICHPQVAVAIVSAIEVGV